MSRRGTAPAGAVVAITGAANGIGKAIAVALAREGARVAIGDLDGAQADAVAAELGHGAIGLPLDVTDHDAFTDFLDEVERTLGPIDVLVNNAGLFTVGPIDREDDTTTARVLAINLHAMMHGTREAVRRMKPRGRGHIINVGSVSSKFTGPNVSTYAATKHGIFGFSESVAYELRGTGVELSVVMPSLCRTAMVAGMKEVKGFPWIEPEDVADAVMRTLRRPRFEVPVPRVAGLTMLIIQALPFRARAGLLTLTKGGSVIDEIDDGAREVYRQRLEAQGLREAADCDGVVSR